MMVQVFTTKVLRENYSVRQIEELARRLGQEGQIKSGYGRPLQWRSDKKTKDIEKELMEMYSDTNVDLTRSRRQIKVVFKFKDEDVFGEFYKRLTK